MSLVYFTNEEVAGLVDPLPASLDIARGFLGLPIRLTFTTGGEHCGHSAHYKGLAVDIGLGHLAEGYARDNYRYLLQNALIKADFKRIEHCPLHTHVDIGAPPDYVEPVLILGQEA